MNTPFLNVDYSAPPLVARYRALFWEPLLGTGERVVAIITIESDPRSTQPIPAGAHVVIPGERLRAMLGRQRGTSSAGVLAETAEFLTACQASGQSIDRLELPFQGMTLGPTLIARGYTVNQMLDAAVRAVSAFGVADDMLEEADGISVARNTVKTAEFLRSLRRYVAGEDEALKARFEKRLKPRAGLPDLTVDYSFKQWMVQVTSLPVTPRQAIHALREAQSKLYELDLIRRSMDGNQVNAVLMVNEDAFATATTAQQKEQASQMLERLKKLAKSDELELVETETPEEGAKVLLALD